MNKVVEIIYQTRQTGNSDWILRSAMRNPDCILVFDSEKTAVDMQRRFHELRSQRSILVRLWDNIFGRKAFPHFVSVNNERAFRGMRKPVIFDNSAMLLSDFTQTDAHFRPHIQKKKMCKDCGHQC